jgi:long-chain acyl-CoA synthetase
MSGTGSIGLRVSVGGDIPGFTSVEELTDGQPTTEPPDRVLGVPINYSSGTTGQPKAVIRPRTRTIDPSVAADGAKTFGHAFQFQPLQGVHLVSAGMHHGGCQGFYLGALHVGQALAILGKFDPEETLAAIARYRVTTAYMVPTQFVRLLRLPQEVKDRYDVSSLEVVVHSAAPCPLEVKKQMMEWWGPGDLGDVRGHGGRGHHRQAVPLAGEAGHGGTIRRRHEGAHSGRGRQRAAAG